MRKQFLSLVNSFPTQGIVKYTIALLFVFFFSSHLSAQTNEETWPGYIVRSSGDTVRGYIRAYKLDRLSRTIYFTENPDNLTERVLAKDLQGFGIEGHTYETVDVDGRLEFAELEMDGEMRLLIYSGREKKGSKYVTVTKKFVRLAGSNRAHEINTKNFRTELPIHVQDHPTLSERIRNREFGYAELEQVVEEYNEWVKAGRPRNAWDKQGGNYTIDYGKNQEEEFTSAAKPYDESIEGPRLGIEGFGLVSFGMLNSDRELGFLGVRFGPGGPGVNAGIGVRYRFHREFVVRGGLGYQLRGFTMNYTAVESNPSPGQEPMQFNIQETWNIGYVNTYIHMDYESENFFFGIGFSGSLFNHNSGKIQINDVAGVPIGDPENLASGESLILQGFNNTFDLNLGTGLLFYSRDRRIRYKPMFMYSIPLIKMINLRSDDPVLASFAPYSLSNFRLQLGLLVDFGWYR
jgi:hypothetical protein